jgi:ribonuclease Z
MVQVTFIGTGAAFSTRQRTNIALLVQEDDTKLLIECGPAILFQLGRVDLLPDQITHLFISHRHGDHILGLPMFLLMCSLGGASRPLTILGSQDTIQAGHTLTHTAYPELDGRLECVTWVGMSVGQPDSIELRSSLRLSTLPVPHSQDAPVLAVRLDFYKSGRSLVYTGDTIFTEEMAAFASGCDLLVHEANFSETLQPDVKAESYGHSTARQAGQTAARADCRVLALVHLSPDYGGCEDQVRAEAAQVFSGQIIVPDDGATLCL